MRVLLTACPLPGHVNPILALALAARRAGHEVAVATGPSMTAAVARAGLTAWPAGPSLAADPPDWPAYFTASAAPRRADLLPRAEAWRPDLVVSEETELAGPLVAAETGARLVIHGLGIMPPAPVWAAAEAALAGAPAYPSAPYLQVCPPSLRDPGPPPRPVVHALRPPLPPAAEGSPELDGLPYEDTIHLTLGTVYHDRRPILAAALEGLRDLPVNVVVAAGPAAATLGRQPSNVLVAPHVSYPDLLPRCRAVVSQGGFGVLTSGLTFGLPQLCLPLGADQFRNAAAATRAGAALTLTEVTAAAVGEAATRLLSEPAFASAAAALRAEIAAMPGADEVMAAVPELAPSG